MLTSDEIDHLQALIAGTRLPETGMEKHFIRVMHEGARPCTEKEGEWCEFWRSTPPDPLARKSCGDASSSEVASSVTNHKRHTEPMLKTPLSVRLCSDCGIEVPPERIHAAPDVKRCFKCQNNFEMHHDTRPRIDEGLAGTREEHKKMRGQLWGDMQSRGRGK
jgi:RNA polymerase-binding transcription factor DksA